MKTKYSIDGGLTWLDAPSGIRVSFEDIDVPGEDAPGQLDFNFTHEGVITDVWVSRDAHLDHNLSTRSQTYDDFLCAEMDTW